MFWVRWRNQWKISWLLRLWRRHRLQSHEEKFLRDIREDLRQDRKLTPRQQGWLDDLYYKGRQRRRR
jgi:hypothetical protein